MAKKPIILSHESLDFAGPIFIVGMPRSGTKLLRTLLNNHSMVGITVNESGYLPYFYKIFDRYQPIHDTKNFGRFYQDFSNTTFFRRLTKDNPFINEEEWFNAIKDWNYAGVIEAFYKYYAASEDKIIWGDKTPSYMLEMPLLKSLFPSAKFIHIIRDVRDYCLSINKAWNKNMYRAAQRWNDSITRSRSDAQEFSSADYLEVYFEQLIGSPELVLHEICQFLGLDFEESLVELHHPSENLGDAKGSKEIKKDNYGKWALMERSRLQKIERICTPLLAQLGYRVEGNQKSIRLSKATMFVYKIIDALNFFRFEIRTNSYEGVKNFLGSMRIARKV